MYLPQWRKNQIYKIASEIVLKHSCSYPIDIKNIAKQLGAELIPYSKLTKYERKALFETLGLTSKDGLWIMGHKNGNRIDTIFYNDSIMPYERQSFTIAHEIGHLVLDHTEHSDLAEAEANMFAGYILAPPELVDLIKPEDYMDVAKTFKLSNECASNAFTRYQRWLNHRNWKSMAENIEYEINMVAAFKKSLVKQGA